jgi:eukaryotic-like serine/threonine-protein kinase
MSETSADSPVSRTNQHTSTRFSSRVMAGLLATGNGIFRSRFGLLPICSVLLLALVSGWMYQHLDLTLRRLIVSGIVIIANSTKNGVDGWMKNQLTTVRSVADETISRKRLAEVLNQPTATTQESLYQHLDPKMKALGLGVYLVVNEQFQVVASNESRRVGTILQTTRQEILAPLFDQSHPGSVISMVYQTDEATKIQSNKPTELVPIFLAASRITVGDRIVGLLAVRIEAGESFSHLFTDARVGDSGETYAFNREGFFLTPSRYEAQLRQFHLLPEDPDQGPILRVRIADPGVELTAQNSQKRSTESSPLTLAIADAVQGRSGSNVEGYRDYRGKIVFGAWKWLDEYGFGIVAEIDQAEAYRTLTLLQWQFFALILIFVGIVLLFSIMAYFSRRRERFLRQAVLQARKVGQYTLEEKIGSGGMGLVYRARHAFMVRPTAIKLLDLDRLSPRGIARFEREVQITSQLNHPNTIAIYDYGRTPEQLFYYAMEYLEGVNLQDYVARYGPMPDGRVISLLIQICGSLQEAHSKQLIHRDIKPANLFLTIRGGIPDFIKVLDFGLVKEVGEVIPSELTRIEATPGTPLYLAPESIEAGQIVDHRVDIYALGVVAYYLLTGRPVFRGPTLRNLFDQHLHAIPESPTLTAPFRLEPELSDLILRCLAKDPVYRPASTARLAELLQEIVPATSWTRQDAQGWWDLWLNQNQATTQLDQYGVLGDTKRSHVEPIILDRTQG